MVECDLRSVSATAPPPPLLPPVNECIGTPIPERYSHCNAPPELNPSSLPFLPSIGIPNKYESFSKNMQRCPRKCEEWDVKNKARKK